MPRYETTQRARRDAREGKAPSTQAGEFVREEIETIRSGAHGARSAKQAIAIGLSKARRAGVELPPPAPGRGSATIRRKARQDLAAGRNKKKPSPKRSRASTKALQKEGRDAASPASLSRQARTAAKRRGATSRRRAARKAVRTKRKRGIVQHR